MILLGQTPIDIVKLGFKDFQNNRKRPSGTLKFVLCAFCGIDNVCDVLFQAESCRVELTENQEKWRCHHHDLELLQQWTSGVLSNVRTLRMSSLSSRQRLTATRLELQV